MDPIWCIAGAAVVLILKNLLSEDVQIQIQIPSLHEDIIFNILTWLPPQKLMELRCVCKSWLNLIEGAYFVDTLAHRSKPCLLRNIEVCNEITPFNFLFGGRDPKSIGTNIMKMKRDDKIVVRNFSTPYHKHALASCRGLLLFGGFKFNSPGELFIANPLTKWWLKLPATSHMTEPLWNNNLFGLTYISSTRKYKVVHYFVYNGMVGCEVLTVGESSWKLVHTSHTRLVLNFSCEKIIFIKDVAYWIVPEILKSPNLVTISKDQFIASLDMIEEKFHKWKHDPSRSREIRLLMELGGVLCFLSDSVDRNVAKFEIWVWKNLTWVKGETIDLAGVDAFLYPNVILGNGKVIVFSCTKEAHCYHLYDVRLKQTTCLKLDGDEDMYPRLLPHMDTLCECGV